MKYYIMIMIAVFVSFAANYVNSNDSLYLAEEDPCNPVPAEDNNSEGGSDCMGQEFVA